MAEENYWSGIAHASEADHDAAFRRYDGAKTGYRFEVSDDFTAARITELPGAANGIWTLAEVTAAGVPRRDVGRLARIMERLAKRAEASA